MGIGDENLRLLLSVVFLVSGASKLVAVPAFRDSVEAFFMNSRMTRIVAWGFPPVELALAIAVWIVVLAAAAEIGLTVILTALVIINIVAIRRRITMACHCFGSLTDEQFGPWSLGKSIVLLIAAAGLFVLPHAIVWPGVSGRLLDGAVAVLGLLWLYSWAVARWGHEQGNIVTNG